MSKNELVLAVGLFVLGNAATIWAVLRWGVNRAIEYTHLKRDVMELQKYRETIEIRHEKTQNDLKGLSIKIDKTKIP